MKKLNIHNVNTLHIHSKNNHPYFEARAYSELDRADAITAYLDGISGMLSTIMRDEEHKELQDTLHLLLLNLDTVKDMIANN